MATILRQALAQQEPPQWVDPYAAQIKALQEQLAQPQGAMYTPEQIAQRRAENQRQYELGLLGQLSGDEGLQAVGGQVLRQALAGRQQRVGERGTTDPITGAFTYSPEFLQAQKEQQLAGLQQRSAAAQGQFQENRQRALERALEAQQRAEDRRALIAAGAAGREPAPPVAIVGPDGVPVLVSRRDAIGKQPAPTAGASNASEDERKAAGWLQQATNAYGQMVGIYSRNPNAALPSPQEVALGRISPDVAYASMSPDRQQFTTAASSFSEALLRAATGAGVNEYEAKQKVAELTPRFGEAPAVTKQKFASANSYIESLRTRAGRAVPGAGAPAGPRANAAASSDPLGLR